MKLWTQWGLLTVAWCFNHFAIRIWPIMNESLNLNTKSDLISAMMYKPFHYVTSFLFVVFFIYITSSIFRKCIYEWKVAFLFRKMPYETMILFVLLLLMYLRMISHFPILVMILTAIIAIYDVVLYLPKRKEKVIYVRE